tara:strand:+ start:3552 stop:3809 length:258 start_codon:yes stop_codon:yes gene_type:complete
MTKENKKTRKVLVELCLNIQKPKEIKVLEYKVESISDTDARISVNAHIFRTFGTFPVSTKVQQECFCKDNWHNASCEKYKSQYVK